MRKRNVLLVVLFIVSSMSYGQEMAPGTGFFTIGIGPSNNYTSYRTNTSPAIRLTYDKGFKEIGPGTLTLGGVLGGFTRKLDGKYFSTSDLTWYSYKWRFSEMIAAFRVGYYYNFGDLDIKELNAYAGIAVGARFEFLSESHDGPALPRDYFVPANNYVNFHMAGFLGVNYFITPNMAIFTEFGYDISYFTLGLTFKM
ncbi:MAG: hypothetical protein CVU05_09805 [Bacteroidetes bacterium HGW-Bacteroidetes-21]|nr:MAG: hypothetical protein CVU05_09805 [Bacteroidetes bacterium HGW-Bacteroidetes-21]